MKQTNMKLIVSSLLILCGPLAAHAGMAPAAGAPAAPTVATATPAIECSSDFKTASNYFQSALGEDATLSRIPSFTNEFAAGPLTINTTNTIKNGGGSAFLEVKLSMRGIPFGAPIHAPVKVCKSGGKLTMNLIMSKAVAKSPKGDSPVKDMMVMVPKNFTLADEVVIETSRTANGKIKFNNKTYPDQPASEVSLLPAAETVR